MRIVRAMLMCAVVVAALATVTMLSSCQARAASHPRVIVLGFDGLDPRLCERMMDAGELPNLDRMRQAGGYRPLGTSIPPQSPVAWASFITGTDPGGHGIFDFIHRDPANQFDPYYSAARTVESSEGWEVGDHRLPLTFWPFSHNPTQTLLRREGTPFWEHLDAAGVPLWLYDIPANYPPSPSKYGNLKCLAGMGVPDLLGTYGTYQHFSKITRRERREGGGIRKPLSFEHNRATASLTGPKNTLLKEPEDTEIEFEIYRHPTERLARIEIQDQTIVLEEGEWSDWCPVSYTLRMPSFLPSESVSGICRFYLQQVRPDFRLYVTPINIDPSNPGGQTVSEPSGFVTEISDELGLFYTTGFQEDHKALSNGVFDDAAYHRQAEQVFRERMNLLRYALRHYDDGLLFFYYSSTDLQAHMFWWDSDQQHPTRSADDAKKYMGVIKDLYRRMDAVVGEVLDRYGRQATILVMSDHGFCNFRRQFALNRWLRDNGYIQPPDCDHLNTGLARVPVDWSRTKAYGLGLNGLYLNLAGRERDGIVDPPDKHALLEELREKLLAVRDPDTGRPVIAEVYRTDQVYHGPHAANAPDLIVGYHRDYRASWATTLGSLDEPLVRDNDEAWSADHCIAADQVPGIVFSNRPIRHASPSLVDLAPTILQEFGLRPPETMTGSSLFEPARVASANAE